MTAYYNEIDRYCSDWLSNFIALTTGADHRDVEKIDVRLRAIENRKCTLMAVNTPNGVTSICTLTD